MVVSRLQDTVARFRTGVKFSPQYNNRSDSRRHDILWWYHVNKCRAMRGNRSELARGAKVTPVSCKHPLSKLAKFESDVSETSKVKVPSSRENYTRGPSSQSPSDPLGPELLITRARATAKETNPSPPPPPPPSPPSYRRHVSTTLRKVYP